MTSPAVQLRHLTKSFGSFTAVDGIDLNINQGEIVAFLGPNGAGKTTTLDMILGLTNPTDGDVSVLGASPRQAVDEGRVSAVLQTGGLLVDMTVRETVQLIASLFKKATPVDEVMERAGITKIAGRRVSKCSGGEQQRVRFALALLPNPDLLILDEPTAGMDVTARREFWDTMRAEAAEGRTVIFATHYLEEADSFAERIVMISEGRIVADGNTSEIRNRSTGRSVRFDVQDVDRAAARLRDMQGVSGVTVEGSRLTVSVTTSASDDVARAVLGDLAGSNLEISTGSLETAFVALTHDREEQS